LLGAGTTFIRFTVSQITVSFEGWVSALCRPQEPGRQCAEIGEPL